MLVVKCGVRKFIRGEALAFAEMRSAAQFYQSLVSIELWRRAGYRAIRSRAVPGLGELDAAYEQLDDEIGALSEGPGGVRGKIRAKRQSESTKIPKRVIPTKKVNVEKDLDVLAELKSWRCEAGALAKPLRKEFAKLVDPALEEHRRRAAVLRIGWKKVKEDWIKMAIGLATLCGSLPSWFRGDKHAMRRSVIQARDTMLAEPEWHSAWREYVHLEEEAGVLRSWVKDARHLSVGTYYAIQKRDFPAACKRPKPRPDGEPRRPKKRPSYSGRRFRRIGWEIKGCTWGDILAGKNGDFRVLEIRDTGGQNGGHYVKQRAIVSLRLRSEERERLASDPDYYRPKHDEPWRVDTEIVIHRPIPADTRVKWVYLIPKEQSPGRMEYSVQFTIEPTSPLIKRAPGTGEVQVNLCWTQDGDTLIVAHVNGEPLRLPLGGRRGGGIIPSLRHAEDIRGVRDLAFDVARKEAVARLDGLSLPEYVTRGIHQWRAPRKLRRLSKMLLEALNLKQKEHEAWDRWKNIRLGPKQGFRWKDVRKRYKSDLFEPDPAEYLHVLQDAGFQIDPNALFPIWLATWMRKDKHLEAIEAGARNHSIARRFDFYRNVAAQLATQYETCVVGGAVDLAALALRDKVEDNPSELHKAARHNRQLACVHELKQTLESAFGPKRYRELSALPPEILGDSEENVIDDVDDDTDVDDEGSLNAAE